ncbi:hypothetical protein ACJ73_03062, partial [Blastomyces percursus]
MDALRHLTARGNDNDNSNDNDNGGLNSSTVNLLISLLALILLSIALIGSYLVIRRRRQRRQLELPHYQDHHHNSSNCRQRGRGGRRLTISASNRDSVFFIDEKSSSSPSSSSSSLSPPTSPVPEIRITFPEEEDATGKRMSGRVVVVRISEKGGIGLEPLDEGRDDGGRHEMDEHLPPYQRQPGGNGSGNGGSTERFQRLDLERMGGLKEKEMDEMAESIEEVRGIVLMRSPTADDRAGLDKGGEGETELGEV